MIQITPQMRVVVAVEPADFRKGIDGLARLCKEVLHHDPFRGWVFVFRNRRATAVKILVYGRLTSYRSFFRQAIPKRLRPHRPGVRSVRPIDAWAVAANRSCAFGAFLLCSSGCEPLAPPRDPETARGPWQRGFRPLMSQV
ncbi:MAG: IS66 family insertion sequence element accessory protein TnpB [Deltaproteobacteria bacterium]|nr:IS66 family insertion sequence element accessory protein TnpB [Deltaproteobacteria bacterium]